jgi:hypothetical protein
LACDEATGGALCEVYNRVKIFRRDGISQPVHIDIEELFGANGNNNDQYPIL